MCVHIWHHLHIYGIIIWKCISLGLNNYYSFITYLHSFVHECAEFLFLFSRSIVHIHIVPLYTFIFVVQIKSYNFIGNNREKSDVAIAKKNILHLPLVHLYWICWLYFHLWFNIKPYKWDGVFYAFRFIKNIKKKNNPLPQFSKLFHLIFFTIY